MSTSEYINWKLILKEVYNPLYVHFTCRTLPWLDALPRMGLHIKDTPLLGILRLELHEDGDWMVAVCFSPYPA